MKRVATVVVALLIVAQIALIGYARASKESDTRPIPPIPPSTEPLFPLAFEGIVDFATEQAQTWKPDAVLVQSNLQVDWPREPQDDPAPVGQIPRGGWIMFAYISGDEMLTIRMDRGSGTIVETRVVGLDQASIDRYLADPLNYDDAAVASLTAMTNFEAQYGNDWRMECIDRRFISWATVVTDPNTGERFWRIAYEEIEGGIGSNLTVDYSWTTGLPGEVINANRPCSEIVDET